MFWPVSIHRLGHPKERHIWVQICILHETDKAKKYLRDLRQRKHCWIVLRTLFRMFYSNSYGINF